MARHQVIGDALAELTGREVVQGKGGFWVRGQGWISLAKARTLTGIPAPKRAKRARVQPWGDYATIAMLNGYKFK